MVENIWKLLIEQLGFDQHPMDPCVFILREPSSRWNELHDDILVIPSVDVGPPVESWGFTWIIKSMGGEAYDGSLR